ncbi:MAG: thiamine pyrophosphate-binding protein [Candidatus Promineifilaceae bacterium]|nr:thiamine pyrophosphate-binding protein [Candidatus Promineifilaceae bacterium]
MATVAEVIARTLVEAGIDTVFGLPGGENAEVLDALRREGLAFVLVRNESSALFMADATARLTGKPGVALVTLGPGAANATSGLANAYLDRAPVLLLTAQSDQRLAGKHTHQVLDLHACFRPISKLTREITPMNARQIVAEALRLTMAGRPGPVHLAVSSFVAAQPVRDGDGEPIVSKVVRSTKAPDLAAAGEMLARAKRPVMVVGLGLEPQRPYAALLRLAEAGQIPVILTPKAKGALAADHPLYAGVIGLTLKDHAYKILDEADCVVAVGFDVVELVRVWTYEQPLIWIAPWENSDPHLGSAVFEFVGEMEPVLEHLADLNYRQLSEWEYFRIATYNAAVTDELAPVREKGRLLPQTLLKVLRDYLPIGTVVTTDVGAHKIYFALEWPAYVPNRYLVANGLSSMGFGLPAAIAAARVTGETTLCIVGDGGMGMVMGELGLLREMELPVIVVVMNDHALDLIRSAQIKRGKAVFGTEFVNPDFRHIAQGFDIEYFRVANRVECAKAVRTAVALERPAMIEALIDPAGYPTTPAF